MRKDENGEVCPSTLGEYYDMKTWLIKDDLKPKEQEPNPMKKVEFSQNQIILIGVILHNLTLNLDRLVEETKIDERQTIKQTLLKMVKVFHGFATPVLKD